MGRGVATRAVKGPGFRSLIEGISFLKLHFQEVLLWLISVRRECAAYAALQRHELLGGVLGASTAQRCGRTLLLGALQMPAGVV